MLHHIGVPMKGGTAVFDPRFQNSASGTVIEYRWRVGLHESIGENHSARAIYALAYPPRARHD